MGRNRTPVERAQTKDRYSSYTYLFLTLIFLFRLIYNTLPPIVPEESYYWKYATHLALSYHDHPPMVAYTIALFTTLGNHSPFWVRLGCALYTLGISLLIHRLILGCRNRLEGEQAGDRADGLGKIAFLAVVTLNASVLFSIGSTIMTPDTPLLFFWTLTVYAVFRVTQTKNGAWWYLAGAALGFALLSKYTAVFLALGTILFLLASPEQRFWFKRKEPYLAALIALVVFSPVLIWNQQHAWDSFLFQSSRRARSWFRFRPGYFGQLVGSQLALVTPVLLLGCLYALWEATRRSLSRRWMVGRASRNRFPREIYRLLLCYSAPVIVLFTLVSFQSLVKMNWLAPAYVTLIVALALLCYERMKNRPEKARSTRRWITATIITAAVMSLLVHVLAVVPVFPMKKADTWTGWPELADRVTELVEEMGPETIIFGNDYKVPSQITFYTAEHYDTYSANLFGGNGLQYEFWNDLDRIAGRDGIFIASDATGVRKWEMDAIERVFRNVEFDGTLEIRRHGRLFRRFMLYRCYEYQGLRSGATEDR